MYMTEQQIFHYLFSLAQASDDDGGVVTSCLVRDGKILAEGVSTAAGTHAEYALLQEMNRLGISVLPTDTVFTTVEPCGKRHHGNMGEAMGDCTTNLIRAGVKRVVFAAADLDASGPTRYKFKDAGAVLEQVKDHELVRKAVELFDSRCHDEEHRLPEQ